jgi:hypothetical protein
MAIAFAPEFAANAAAQNRAAGDVPVIVDGTARDGAGDPSRPSSSGGPPVVASSQRLLDLARGVEQPFTVGTFVRAVERDGVPVSQALSWLRSAEGSLVTATGERRASSNALRGARLYQLRG